MHYLESQFKARPHPNPLPRGEGETTCVAIGIEAISSEGNSAIAKGTWYKVLYRRKMGLRFGDLACKQAVSPAIPRLVPANAKSFLLFGRWKFWQVAVALFVAVFLFHGFRTGNLSLLNNDEARFGEASREMRERRLDCALLQRGLSFRQTAAHLLVPGAGDGDFRRN